MCDILHRDWGALLIGAQRNVSEIVKRSDIAAPPHHVFALARFDDTPPDVVVAAADGLDHFLQRDVIALELVRIDLHLVLLDESTDRGHLSHPWDALEPVAQIPVLEAAQLGEVVLT